jgi:transcriptional regulator with XRE-family HTH domain
MKAVGKRVALRRKVCEISQRDLAQTSKIHYATIAAIELGKRKPTFEQLIRLADVLNLSTDELLGVF